MVKYETLLDLAAQALAAKSASQSYCKDDRNMMRGLQREIERELDAHLEGKPLRQLSLTVEGSRQELVRRAFHVVPPLNDLPTVERQAAAH